MSYLDNLYRPSTINESDITVTKKYKGMGDLLKHYAKRAAAGAAITGLAGYGLYRAGQDGKAALINAKNKFHEDALNPRFTGAKSMVDGYNTFAALGYKRPENLKKLNDKLFGKRDDTEPVVTGWFGNPSQYNNG
jgi:hypothetical protein